MVGKIDILLFEYFSDIYSTALPNQNVRVVWQFLGEGCRGVPG